MYSRSIVERKLVIAAEELGWMPEYHTPAEIDTFVQQIERKYEGVYANADRKSVV